MGVTKGAADVLLEGKLVGHLTVGQTVTILGESDENNEVLVSYTDSSGATVVGMIPADKVVKLSGERPPALRNPNAFEPGPEVRPQPARNSSAAPMTAEEFAEMLKNNRQNVAEYLGSEFTISGRIDSLKVSGAGASRTVEATIATRTDLAKIKANFPFAYLNSKEFMEKIKLDRDRFYPDRAQSLNIRSRSNLVEGQYVWERKETHQYSGGQKHDYSYKNDSGWLPFFTAGNNITFTAKLQKFAFDIQMDDAKLAD